MRWRPDRWRFYGLVGSEALRAVRGAVLRAAARPGLALRARPSALLITPPDLRTSDPTVANDIYAGLFVFAGRSLATGGRSPFDFAPPSAEWGEALYGFGWLRHLDAANSALARSNARALVQDFLAGRGDDRAARQPSVAARRLIALLSRSPLLLEGADHAFYRSVLKGIDRAVRDLELGLKGGLAPQPRLLAAVALCMAGLCCAGLDGTLRRGRRLLARELDRQVLPDGGHRSRDPHFALELLLDLLPLRQSFLSRDVAPPEALAGAIDRMLPYLRLLRHGDGSLGHVNGMGVTAADHLATLLAYDGAIGRPLLHAPYSGYARIEAGSGLVLVADIGAPPPLIHSREATGGCLAFELTSGPARIVVNCGRPLGSAETRRAARLTAAHSTATVAETSSARILAPRGWWPGRRVATWLMGRLGPVVLEGPRETGAERSRLATGATRLVARHDGYRRDFGLVHERRWTVGPQGDTVEGEDLFGLDPGRRAAPVAIRFHLHPGVRARRSGDRAVHLTLATGEEWEFASPGVTPALADSVFFAGLAGARRCDQIVLALEVAETTTVAWSFRRLGG